MTDFSVDYLGLKPDQNVEHRYNGCVGETVADIIGNIFKIPMDAGYSEAAGFFIAGNIPTTAGENPRDGMVSAVAYGSLPKTEIDFDAVTMGELYDNNFQNYSAIDRASALKYVVNGVKTLDLTFDAVVNSIATTGIGVSLPLKWSGIDQNDCLLTAGPSFSNHNTAAYGVKTINGQQCLIIKPWCGPNYGDGGYVYLSRDVFKSIVFGAYSFDMTANRWVTLVGIAITKFPFLADKVSNLLKSGPSGSFPNTQDTIYNVAVECLGTRQTLDTTVPAEEGCAEAVSSVLKKSGIQGIPDRGFASTIDMYHWLLTNTQFKLTSTPQYGSVVISPTQGVNTGHVGICLKKGIASNNSFGGVTGLFTENYSFDGWVNSFHTVKGLPVYYFVPVA